MRDTPGPDTLPQAGPTIHDGNRLALANEAPPTKGTESSLVTNIARALERLPYRDQLLVADQIGRLVEENRWKATTEKAAAVTRGIPSAAIPYTLDTVEMLFTNQPWASDQIEIGNRIREACTFAAKNIVRELAPTPLQQRAIALLHEAQMVANLAITWRGQL